MMPLCVPVSVFFTVSVAVMDWVPGVRRVTVKVPTPLVSVAFAGRVARRSLLVIATVPL